MKELALLEMLIGKWSGKGKGSYGPFSVKDEIERRGRWLLMCHEITLPVVHITTYVSTQVGRSSARRGEGRLGRREGSSQAARRDAAARECIRRSAVARRFQLDLNPSSPKSRATSTGVAMNAPAANPRM